MKNLNIFRRLDELETANMHLQVMLKSARADIKNLQIKMDKTATPKPEPKVKTTKQILKQQEYSRKYYFKKKAQKLAAMEAA
jgi:predicted rRNA methylase YqxC with S4 and FtsJ domains